MTPRAVEVVLGGLATGEALVLDLADVDASSLGE